MAAFFFYNNRKPRKFNYKPVLYNPEEEEMKKHVQKRINAVKKEMGIITEEEVKDKTDFKAEFVSQTRHLRKRHDRMESGRNTFLTNNWLLILIAVALFGVFFFWLLR